MTEKLNILLNVDSTDFCIESNINFRVPSHELYAQVWHHPNGQRFASCLHTAWGEHALTDAVLWLSEHLAPHFS
jgi:hypothetical protein